MRTKKIGLRLCVLLVLAMAVVTGGCSGSREDVRVTLCKRLTEATQPQASSIEWLANENTFRRPEYASTGLRFEVLASDGTRTAMTSACHYAYDALEDTAQHLSDPLSAYATLPFAMTVDGEVLSDAALLQLVNAEQKRQGRAVLRTLEKGARDMADKVRAGMGG